MRTPGTDQPIGSHPQRRRVSSPDFAGQVSALIEPRIDPDCDESNTAQTVARMAQYAREDSQAEIVRAAAYAATAGATSAREIAERIFAWIKAHVQFREDHIAAAMAGIEDPLEAEVLIRPVDLLAMPMPQGDCDDFSMLTAAMLRAMGVPSQFVTVAAEADMPDVYSHVYVEAQLDGVAVPIDSSHGPRVGWSVPPKGKTRRWPVEVMPPSTLNAIDWGKIIESAVNTTGTVLTTRFGVPQAKPGTYVQRPDGTVIYQQQPGAGPLSFPGASLQVPGSSSTGLLLLAAAGLALVLLMRK
jgi:Transglutaminase-like superfamily